MAAHVAAQQGLAHEIVLIDAVAGKAEAEAKDLMHGSMFVPAVEVSAGGLDLCKGARIVVITAGAKQQPGQTRPELTTTNARIYREISPKILQSAPEALLLV